MYIPKKTGKIPNNEIIRNAGRINKYPLIILEYLLKKFIINFTFTKKK
tara:strand:- start:551 stop:694 length:144 start_codon:yes stop_codon:yes gene_type:complete